MGWSDQDIEILTNVISNGGSASEAACTCTANGSSPKTRNSCLSKADRLFRAGIIPRTFHSTTQGGNSKPPPAEGNGTKKRRAGGFVFGDKISTTLKPPMNIILVTNEELLAAGITIMEIRHGRFQCRFPLNDPFSEYFKFCGRPTTPGESWCRDIHWSVVFQRPVQHRKPQQTVASTQQA